MDISKVIEKALGLTGLEGEDAMPELATKKLMADIVEKNVAGYVKMLQCASEEELVAEIYKRFDARDLQRLVLVLVMTGQINLEVSDVDDEEKPKKATGGRRAKAE